MAFRTYFFLQLAILAFFSFSCTTESEDLEDVTATDSLFVLECGAEEIVQMMGSSYLQDKERPGDVDSGGWRYNFRKLDGYERRLESVARTGEFSVMLTPTDRFAMTYITDEFEANQMFKVSAWRIGGSGQVVWSAETNPEWIQTISTPTGKKDGPWEEIAGYLMLPPHLDSALVRFYVYNAGEDTVLFDDLRIEQVKSMPFPSYENPIVLTIPTEGMQHMQKQKETAFRDGVLNSGKKDFQTAFISNGNAGMDVQVRLKGDWLDHLQGEKWSFRLLHENGESYSLQTPEARFFLNEWVLHKVMEKENILATDYEFVPLELNGKSLGMYAKEEHFTQKMLEKRNLPPGPILRLTEDQKWEVVSYLIKEKKDQGLELRMPSFEAALPDEYESKFWSESPEKKAIQQKALRALRSMQQGKADAATYIDKQKMARFIALCDVSKAWHGLTWHNLRFYFNPQTELLEPIGFDHYSETGSKSWAFKEYLGQRRAFDQEVFFAKEYFLLQFFNDAAFRDFYFEALKMYTDPMYWENALSELEMEILSLEKQLQNEFPNYRFDFEAFPNNAEELANKLKSDQNDRNANPYFKRTPFKWPGDTCLREAPFKGLALQAYHDGETIKIYNYHCAPLKLIGSSTTATPDSMQKVNNGPIWISPTLQDPESPMVWTIFQNDAGGKGPKPQIAYIWYKAPPYGSILKCKIRYE